MKFSYEDGAKITTDGLSASFRKLSSMVVELRRHTESIDYGNPEDFLAFVSDEKNIAHVKRIVAGKGGKLKWIYLVGIGGANLGAQAVTLALRYSVSGSSPKFIFFDAIDQLFLEHVKENASNLEDKTEFLILIISKSGETLETIVNARAVLSILGEKFGDISDRVLTFSIQDSPMLRDLPSGVEKITLYRSVVDRFSVFSPVGLIPILFGGIDIDEFLAGAKSMREKCLSEDLKNNPAAISASMIYHWYKKGVQMRDLFFFLPELEYLGKWSRQLIAESLGKNGEGITPIVSIGTTDLHSIAQLHLEGPKNRFINFIFVEKWSDYKINSDPSPRTLMPKINNKSLAEINFSIYCAYLESVRKKGLPFTEIIFDDLSARSLGEYMQFLMIETLFSAHLLKVNAFSQPAVEEYKSKAREVLT